MLKISPKTIIVNQDLTPNGGTTKKEFDSKSANKNDIEESIIKACKRDANQIYDETKS